MKRTAKSKCVAFKPKPTQPHIGCLPGECDLCYTKCGNPTNGNGMVCTQCFNFYLYNPDARLAMAFMANGVRTQTLTVPQLKQFSQHSSAEVRAKAQYALDAGLLTPTLP